MQNINLRAHSNEPSIFQTNFENMYITSQEICEDLNIKRSVLKFARDTGKLPPAIVLNKGQVLLWRRDEVKDYLSSWKIILKAKRQGV